MVLELLQEEQQLVPVQPLVILQVCTHQIIIYLLHNIIFLSSVPSDCPAGSAKNSAYYYYGCYPCLAGQFRSSGDDLSTCSICPKGTVSDKGSSGCLPPKPTQKPTQKPTPQKPTPQKPTPQKPTPQKPTQSRKRYYLTHSPSKPKK